MDLDLVLTDVCAILMVWQNNKKKLYSEWPPQERVSGLPSNLSAFYTTVLKGFYSHLKFSFFGNSKCSIKCHLEFCVLMNGLHVSAGG